MKGLFPATMPHKIIAIDVGFKTNETLCCGIHIPFRPELIRAVHFLGGTFIGKVVLIIIIIIGSIILLIIITAGLIVAVTVGHDTGTRIQRLTGSAFPANSINAVVYNMVCAPSFFNISIRVIFKCMENLL
jgi:hypothetical protein